MSQIERVDIDAVPVGPELDAVVAVEVMGWTRVEGKKRVFWTLNKGYIFGGLRGFSTDANAVREVEAEIERRGLMVEYIKMLISVVFNGKRDETILFLDDWFQAVHASAEQRCRAALRVVMG